MVLSMKSVVTMAACASAVVSATPAIQFDLTKHIGTLNSKSIVSKDGSGILSFELLNQQSFFSVDVQIGTPAQNPVVLLIDTGSSDMWVNGAEVCLPGTYSNISTSSNKKRYESSVLDGFELTATYPSTYFDAVSTDFIQASATATGTAASASSSAATGINCEQYGAFSTGLSSSWKELDLGEPFSIEYVDTTQADGVYGTDSLAINGVSVSNVTFAVATFSNSSQGVLGISLPQDESLFTNYENGTTYNNLPQQLKADGLISKVSYSLFLNSLCDKSGSLLFGAINSDWYVGELNTVPLVNIYPNFSDTPIEFDITVNGVGISDYPKLGDKKTLTKTNFPGVLDSGTTLMQLPPDLAFALADSLDFVFNDAFGWFVGSCPSAEQLRDSSIVFNIGGINYYTPLNNFIYTTSSPEVCAFVVSPFTSDGGFTDANDYGIRNNYAILGDVFLTSMFVVYDLESYEITLGVANYEGYASGGDAVEQIVSTVPGAKQAPGYSNTWSTWEYITHYSGDESDGIFTNADEVNPWISTADFGCTVSISTTASSTKATKTSATTSASTTTAKSASTPASTVSSNTLASSTSAPTVSSTTTLSSSSDPASTSSAAGESVSTVTASQETTTLVTITSCKDNACSLTTSEALVSIATVTLEGTVTEYTTYCPLTAANSSSTTSLTLSTSEEKPSTATSFSSSSSTANKTVSTESNAAIKGTSISFLALVAGLFAAF